MYVCIICLSYIFSYLHNFLCMSAFKLDSIYAWDIVCLSSFLDIEIKIYSGSLFLWLNSVKSDMYLLSTFTFSYSCLFILITGHWSTSICMWL